MSDKIVTVGDISIGGRNQIALIAGPCVIESEYLLLSVAEKIKNITKRAGIRTIFKSSFDKANRTSINSFRGPGLEAGLRMLERVKHEFDLPILTDIHLPQEAMPAAEVADILQIPAFLCRQTDLLVAAAKTGKVINVKKGQFLAPWDMKNVADKIIEAGNQKVMLCERGTSFGYNNLIVDMTGLIEMNKMGMPVVFDATHSVQKPGGEGTSTGGNREYVKYLSRAAAAVGIHALFLETHPDPDKAFSDGPNMVPLNELERLLIEVKQIDDFIKNGGAEIEH